MIVLYPNQCNNALCYKETAFVCVILQISLSTFMLNMDEFPMNIKHMKIKARTPVFVFLTNERLKPVAQLQRLARILKFCM